MPGQIFPISKNKMYFSRNFKIKTIMATNKDNFCVIMGGGIGSRFWPFSRKTQPKQFLDFFGTGRSLLQQTFDRFKKIIPTENILVVTNALYADLVQKQRTFSLLPTLFMPTLSKSNCPN